MLDVVRQDLRQALRALLGRPRFSVPALGAFAVGITANLAVFRVVDDALLDPLPWPDAERTVAVWDRYPERGIDRIPAAPGRYLALGAEDDVFDAVAAYRRETVDLDGHDGPERAEVGAVDPALFPLLGIRPAAGRFFAEGEDAPGGPPVAVLSHGRWVEGWGADPAAVGATVVLDGVPHEIVGVLPPGDAWPDGVALHVPLVLPDRADRGAHAYRAVARLARGVDGEDADRRLADLSARWASEHPATDAGWEAYTVPLRDEVVGGLGPVLLLLQGAVGLLLLVAAGNAAALLLAHASGRRGEMAVRAALGASRGRLARQLVLECVLLALGGAALAVPLSGPAVGAVAALAPGGLPGATAALDPSVLAAATAVAVAAGVLFGLLPAVRGTGADPAAGLRGAATGVPAGPGRVHGVLVAAQVALAAVLLVGGSLLVRSLEAVGDVDPGFAARGILAAEVQPAPHRYPDAEARARLYGSLLDAVGSAPGVRSAALVSDLPVAGRTNFFRFLVEGRPAPASPDELVAEGRAASPGYFATMEIPLLRGRGVTGADGPRDEKVVVVDETMAGRHWPGGGAVGSRLSLAGPDGPWLRVVGVVGAVRSGGPTGTLRPAFYVPLAQQPPVAASLVARAAGDPLELAASFRAAAARVDPALPLGALRTGSGLLRAASAPWRFQAVLVSAFATAAGLLAVLGVFGLVTLAAHRREREMGIRRALGAGDADVRRLVRGHALRLAGPGVAVGLLGGAVAARALRDMLFGVDPLDPWSYLVASGLLLGAALAAAARPARRAARVEPADALRRS